jgi:Tfp pilus assembly protein PilF
MGQPCPACANILNDGEWVCPKCGSAAGLFAGLTTGEAEAEILVTDDDLARPALEPKEFDLVEGTATNDRGTTGRFLFYASKKLSEQVRSDHVISRLPAADESSPALTPYERQVLGVIDGKATVAELELRSRLSAEDLSAALMTLLSKRLVASHVPDADADADAGAGAGAALDADPEAPAPEAVAPLLESPPPAPAPSWSRAAQEEWPGFDDEEPLAPAPVSQAAAPSFADDLDFPEPGAPVAPPPAPVPAVASVSESWPEPELSPAFAVDALPARREVRPAPPPMLELPLVEISDPVSSPPPPPPPARAPAPVPAPPPAPAERSRSVAASPALAPRPAMAEPLPKPRAATAASAPARAPSLSPPRAPSIAPPRASTGVSPPASEPARTAPPRTSTAAGTPASGMKSVAPRPPLDRTASRATAPAMRAGSAAEPRVPLPRAGSSVQSRASKLYEAAMKDKAAGNLISAEMNMKLALSFDPNNFEYRRELAGLSKAAKDEKDNVTPGRQLYDQATEAERNGDVKKALRLLEKALAAEPKNPTFLNRLGALLVTNGELERGRELIQEAIELAPENETYTRNLARVETMITSEAKKSKRGKSLLGGLFKKGE